MDFVRRWSEKTEIGAGRFIAWLDTAASKFYDWRDRYGKVHEHNGWVTVLIMPYRWIVLGALATLSAWAATKSSPVTCTVEITFTWP